MLHLFKWCAQYGISITVPVGNTNFCLCVVTVLHSSWAPMVSFALLTALLWCMPLHRGFRYYLQSHIDCSDIGKAYTQITVVCLLYGCWIIISLVYRHSAVSLGLVRVSLCRSSIVYGSDLWMSYHSADRLHSSTYPRFALAGIT